MKRADVAQQIKFYNEEIAFLSRLKTNCITCFNLDVDSCKIHGEVPKEFLLCETCPDWEHDPAPF